MSSIRGKAACSLSLLIGRAGFLEELSGDPQELVMGDKHMDSLLRQYLERRSDAGFLNSLHGDFRDAGLSSGEALACLRKVVNAPGAALMRKRSGGGREHLQAVLMKDGEDGEAYLVTVRVTMDSGKPPQVVEATADLLPVSIADLEDQAGLTEFLEDRWREYGVREITLPELTQPKVLAWLGDPRSSGYHDVPADWAARLRAVASVLGMRTQIVADANQLHAQREQLLATADVIALLHGWPPGRRDDSVRERNPLVLGSSGSSFSDLLMAIRQGLLPIALGTERNPFEVRELLPGEIVYHRKVEKRGKKRNTSKGPDYDHFDAGSSTPCSHGAEGFTPFKHADKAAKGMARRYSNFYNGDVQLKHCGKYPNCGMYAVERRGPKSDAD
jgi:hypothetical protein